jgi:heme oxygenase
MIAARLKDETRPLHDAVERAVGIPDRPLTPARYRHLLARFHGYYAPLEDRLGRADLAPVGLDFGARRKAALLEHDLLALGLAAGAVRDLPRCPDLPAVDGLGDALGCLYVLEGATLGGRVITRHVGQTLGLRPGAGCSFFASYRDRVGAMWAEFGAALAAFAAAGGDADAVVRAAKVTFTTLGRWVEAGDADG